MGQTFSEKILSRKAGHKIRAGDVVTVSPDYILTHDNTAAIIKEFQKLGIQKVRSPEKIVVVLEELFRGGAIISNPGCGGCAEGHIGLTGRGEIQISTGNRNFAGKQGKGATYLASPAVVAASCVRGEICSPEDL